MTEHELEFNYEEARELMTHVKQLMEHPGWKLFLSIVNTRRESVETQLMGARITNVEGIAEFNRLQGMAIELSTLPNILEHVRLDLESQIKRAQDEEQAAQEESDDVY